MTIKVNVQPLRPNMMFTDQSGFLTKDAYEFLFAVFQRIGGSLSSLDAASLLGANWSNPNPIGDTTPNTGRFTKFGCNGTTPQGPATVGSLVATTGAITSGYGYSLAQANDIVTKLNAVITALKNNGIAI